MPLHPACLAPASLLPAGCSGWRGVKIVSPRMRISAAHGVGIALRSASLLFAFDSPSCHFAVSTLIQLLLG